MPATPYPSSFADARQRDQILQAVQASLQIIPTCSRYIAPGQLLTATLSSTSPLIDVSSLVNGFINVAWAAKDVIFQSVSGIDVPNQGDVQGDDVLRGLVTPSVSGPQPFPPPPPQTPPVSPTAPSGMLGQLFGGLALPSLKVHASFRWILREPGGDELDDGEQCVATQGLRSPTVAFAIPPVFQEMRLDTLMNPGGQLVCLWCDVTLWLEERIEQPADPKWEENIHRLQFSLGGVPFIILPLLIPTVVAMFTEPNFGVSHSGGVALLVPQHCPIGSAEALINHLKKIENVLSAVRDLVSIAAFLAGFSELVSALPEQPRIRLIWANGVNNLGKITLKPRPWYHPLGSDRTIGDEIQSIIVIGLSTKVVEKNAPKWIHCGVNFYIDTDYKIPGEGYLLLPINRSQMFRMIRALQEPEVPNRQQLPPVFPPLSPSEAIKWDKGGSGGDKDAWNKISSVRFDNQWLDAVKKAERLRVPELVCKAKPEPVV